MGKRSQALKRALYGIDSDGYSTLTTPTNTAAPTQTGLGKVGNQQVCHPGTWTGSSASTYYQWKLDGVAIANARLQVYTPVASDSTHALTCAVTVANLKGALTVATAAVTVVP